MISLLDLSTCMHPHTHTEREREREREREIGKYFHLEKNFTILPPCSHIIGEFLSCNFLCPVLMIKIEPMHGNLYHMGENLFREIFL